MEMRGMMGGFYRMSEWIMRLSAVNLMWVLCSIPVLFLIYLQLVVMTEVSNQPGFEQFTLYDIVLSPLVLIMAVIAPFTFFPGTAALFSMTRKWIMGDTDIKLIRSFFGFFKANFKQAMMGGFFFGIAFIILLINLQFYFEQTTWMANLYLVFIVFLLVMVGVMFNFFCYLAHFEMPFWQMLRNSLLFTIARLFNTVTIIVMNGLILYISLFKFTFLIPFFMVSFMGIITFWSFYRSILRIQEKVERQEEALGEGES